MNLDKHTMRLLVDAPLANACKINLPAGRRAAPRPKKAECDDIGGPKLTGKELRERKTKDDAAKLDSLFDYYATTNLTADRVAEHLGIYRQEQDGTDDAGKPIMRRVLDVERAETQLAWRRKAQAA